MAIETDTERIAMLSDFSVSASYTPDGGSPTAITVLFDKPYVGVSQGGEVLVESSNPTAFCKTSDVSDADHAATLEINGITYNVVGVQPDGEGERKCKRRCLKQMRPLKRRKRILTRLKML